MLYSHMLYKCWMMFCSEAAAWGKRSQRKWMRGHWTKWFVLPLHPTFSSHCSSFVIHHMSFFWPSWKLSEIRQPWQFWKYNWCTIGKWYGQSWCLNLRVPIVLNLCFFQWSGEPYYYSTWRCKLSLFVIIYLSCFLLLAFWDREGHTLY